jgi:hypothetical protein
MSVDRSILIEALGWSATAVFVGSYFFRRAESLARAQMLGALMWAFYGVLVKAPPVVAANLLVLGAAAWKARRPAGAPVDPPVLAPVSSEERRADA